MNVLTEQQAAEILAREVAEEIDQTGMAKDGKVLFEGQAMKREDVARIVDNRLLAGRKAANFDPQDAIEDGMPLGPVRLRLRTNILWSLAYKVIGATRDVLFRMNEFARETGTIDGWNEFYAQLSEAESSAAYAEQMGYAHYGSGLAKARALMSLYAQWRELAIKDAKMLRTKNTLPEIYSLVNEAPQYDPSELEKALYVVREVMKGQSEDVIAKALIQVEAKVKAEHTARVEQAKAMAPHLMHLLAIVADGAEGEHVRFPELPIEVQGSIIESVANSAKRLPDQLVKMRSVSMIDMVTSLPLIEGLKGVLLDALNDPRFETV